MKEENMTAPDDLYNQILADGPSPGTLYRLLLKMKEEGLSKRVIREGVKALTVYPSDLYIRKLLAETFYEVGCVAQAHNELEKLLEQFETFTSAYKLKAEILHQQKKEEEAAKNLKLYLAHRPDDQEAIEILQDLDPSVEMGVAEPTPSFEEPQPDMEAAVEGKKEKLLAVLEAWRTSIREMSNKTL